MVLNHAYAVLLIRFLDTLKQDSLIICLAVIIIGYVNNGTN